MKPNKLFKKLGIIPSYKYKKYNGETTYHFGDSRIYYEQSIEKKDSRLYDIRIHNEGKMIIHLTCYDDYVNNIIEVIKSHIQYLK